MPFLLIFVTRPLRNPAQIADFARFFCTKRGFCARFCQRLLLFWSGLTRNFGVGTRNSGPRNSFFGARNFYFGARNFYFGARMKKSRYGNFFAAAPGVFFFPVGTFSRTHFPCRFVGGIPRRAFPPVGFLRRECPVSRQKGRLGGDSATF